MNLPIPRRHFLKTGALGLGGILLANSVLARATEEKPVTPVKIGIIGCGGRGMGAATDALDADPGVLIWAMADVFMTQIDDGIKLLTEQYDTARIQVPAERRFDGLDGYKKLLSTDVDIVLLTAPPVFRPDHIRATVNAGKALFAEKPVAVDVPGIHSVLESAKIAQEKNLLAYDGFCWRFDLGCRAALDELKKGSFGKALGFMGTYYAVPPKTPMSDNSRPSSMTDVQWAIKNWTAWNWLSGGSFVEQVVHTVDLMTWAFNEEHPVAAFGSGGRAQRTDQGDVWDHYQIQFEFPKRVQAIVSSRQWSNCYNETSDRILCEKGTLYTPYRPRFEGEKRWRYSGEACNMYKNTHVELLADYRAQNAKNLLEIAAYKTLTAILGRTAAQTGQRITWDEILKDTTTLTPENLTLESSLPPPLIPVPGRPTTPSTTSPI